MSMIRLKWESVALGHWITPLDQRCGKVILLSDLDRACR